MTHLFPVARQHTPNPNPNPPHSSGDRETEAVFIGVGLDRAAILAALEAALVTDAEFAAGEAGWRDLEDVFFGGRFFRPPERERPVFVPPLRESSSWAR